MCGSRAVVLAKCLKLFESVCGSFNQIRVMLCLSLVGLGWLCSGVAFANVVGDRDPSQGKQQATKLPRSGDAGILLHTYDG